jgi:hypothetical protein
MEVVVEGVVKANISSRNPLISSSRMIHMGSLHQSRTIGKCTKYSIRMSSHAWEHKTLANTIRSPNLSNRIGSKISMEAPKETSSKVKIEMRKILDHKIINLSHDSLLTRGKIQVQSSGKENSRLIKISPNNSSNNSSSNMQ